MGIVDTVPPADVDGGLPGAPWHGDWTLPDGVHWGQRQGRGDPHGAWAPFQPQSEEAETCKLGPRGASPGEPGPTWSLGPPDPRPRNPALIGGAFAPSPPRDHAQDRFLFAGSAARRSFVAARTRSDLWSLSQRSHRELCRRGGGRGSSPAQPKEAGGGGLWTHGGCDKCQRTGNPRVLRETKIPGSTENPAQKGLE